MTLYTRRGLILAMAAWAVCLVLLAIIVAQYQALRASAAPAVTCGGPPQWCQFSSANLDSSPHELEGVSVFTGNNVLAVGVYSESDPGGLLLTQQYLPNIGWTSILPFNSGPYNVFHSISSKSNTDAWAAGEYFASYPSPEYTLVDHWNGNSWIRVQSGNPNSSGSILYGISEVGAGNAWAVGTYNSSGDVDAAFTEHCTISCSVVSVPSLSPEDNILNGVAAVSSNDVWAVGSYVVNYSPFYHQPIIMHYTGTWSLASYPNLYTDAFLESVDYYASNDVWAVGSYKHQPDGYYRPLIAHWDGISWSFDNINFGSGYYFLHHVFVTNEREVWAVGDYRSTLDTQDQTSPFTNFGHFSRTSGSKSAPTLPVNGSHTFVLHWHGSALNEYTGNYWDNPSSDSPGTGSQLLGVAAPIVKSAGGKLPITETWAVGSYTDTSTQPRTLVENLVAPVDPPTSISYLVNNVDATTFYTTGYCSLNNSVGGVVVLDFGAPDVVTPTNAYGTKLFDLPTAPPTTTFAISNAVESFIRGYDTAYRGIQHPETGCKPPAGLINGNLSLALGTSNDNSFGQVTSGHANAWANLVNDVQNYTIAQNYNEVGVIAAIDIEPAYSHPTDAIGWVQAYANRGVSYLYNFGATENYPCETPSMSLPTGLYCAGINNEWVADKFYTVSYGMTYTRPLPEIYHNTDSMYWYQISRWGVNHYSQNMLYAGEMTDYYYTTNQADYSPDEGWQALWLELNSEQATEQPSGGMRLPTDIQCITKPPDLRQCYAH